MSQQRKPQRQTDQPVKYGDVLPVTGDLAQKPVALRDAAMMQATESTVFGQTLKGGPAAAMQSAATVNERAGLVSRCDASDATGKQGVTVTEAQIPGARIITESVTGQVVGQFLVPQPVQQGGTPTQGGQGGGRAAGTAGGRSGKITIGEALEAVAATAGDKVVDQSDAAAIQAAEMRATGTNVFTSGGLTSTAQSAASLNFQSKVKLADVLTNATMKLPDDKEVTRQDAEGVVGAELRNNPNVSTHPGGVAASVAAAARLNEQQPK